VVEWPSTARPRAYDPEIARRLREVQVALTGIRCGTLS
jgi:hypothetical protein